MKGDISVSLDILIEKIARLQNPTVAGLDAKFENLPGLIRQAAVDRYGRTLEAASAAILEFNKGLIDALYDIVPAVKPQSAYYEMYGWQGMKTLQETSTFLIFGSFGIIFPSFSGSG